MPATSSSSAARASSALRSESTEAVSPAVRPSLAGGGEAGRVVGVHQRLHHRVEVTVQYGVEIVRLVVDAVVGDAVLREVVGAHALGAVDGADLAAPVRRCLGLGL